MTATIARPSPLADRVSPGRAAHARTWLTDAAVALLATALLVAWSIHAGRLALPPQYDDVAYLRQALQWVHILRHDGPAGVLNSYWQTPAHAPLHDVMGAASFLLFGIHDWAPYAGRALVILLLLRICRRILSAMAPPMRWALTAVILTTPCAQTLVTEFRPDPIYGLLLATAMLFVLTRPLADASWRRCILAGALFAAVLLTKTSTYPQTLAFMLGVLTLRIAADWMESRPLRRTPARAALIVAVALLIPLPHYLVAWRVINYYIHITLFGERRHIWVLAGDAMDHLLYYLVGDAGRLQLGLRLPIALAIAAVGAIATWRFRPAARWTNIIVLLTLGITFALPTANPTKSIFLGMTFNFMLLLGGLWLLNAGYAGLSAARGQRHADTTVLTLAVCAIALWHPRLPVAGEATGDVGERHRIAWQLYEAMRPYLRTDPQARVMVTASGSMINPDLFAYWALKYDDVRIATELNIFSDDFDYHRRAFRQATLVIAGERFNGEANAHQASSAVQDQTLAMAQAMPELLPVARVKAHNDRFYHVLVRADVLATGTFVGFEAIDGLTPQVGPFPQHRLPVMRSGTGAATTLRFDHPTGGDVVLILDAMAVPPARTLRISINGQPADQEVRLDPPFQFQRFPLRLRASAGENRLTITYDPAGGEADKVVHFRRLQIIPAPAAGPRD